MALHEKHLCIGNEYAQLKVITFGYKFLSSMHN